MKDNLTITIQFLALLMTIMGGAFYLGQEVASLSTDVKNLKVQVERLTDRVDGVKESRHSNVIHFRRTQNYVKD